jgi:aspartate/methionine/tyrosine aminotransferase
MWFERMSLEVWFDDYQYLIENDIGESAVKFLTVEELGIDLNQVALRYGHHTGEPNLRECIARQYAGLSAEHIVVTSGASEAIFSLNAALVKPGDHVIVEHPNYPSLYDIPESLGCDVSLYALQYDKHFKPDLEELEALMTAETRMISFTHPNNPTGSMISVAELEALVQFCEDHDVYLLFDETYRDLDFENALPPAATLSPRAISISTMSKCYGLPGIRIGWLAARDPSILDAILTIREQVTITNNALGEAIALHVLSDREKYLNKARQHVEANRKLVTEWIENHAAFEWVAPEAGVVGLPRIKEGIAVDPETLYRRLAEKYKTFAVPGRCFGLDNRHFRLGFGATRDEIRQGLKNLDSALAESSAA